MNKYNFVARKYFAQLNKKKMNSWNNNNNKTNGKAKIRKKNNTKLKCCSWKLKWPGILEWGDWLVSQCMWHDKFFLLEPFECVCCYCCCFCVHFLYMYIHLYVCMYVDISLRDLVKSVVKECFYTNEDA